MPGHFPTLDKTALLKLRELVKQMQSENGSSVQLPKLLELANSFNEGTGLTVDFDASKEFGQPLVIVRAGNAPQYPQWADLLTPREKEVLQLIASGLANKQIAAQLFISIATVKDHVHNILVKSGLPSRSALVSQWPAVSPLEAIKP
jgi:DNA-binding CsgD family transcriptional regulator